MAHAGNPHWWGAQQTSTWDRVKEALSRDWEQTKADFSNEYGKDLNQSATDTVKQAVGKEPIPPPGAPNPLDESLAKPQLNRTPSATIDRWNEAEPAIRYGYGAAHHYQDQPSWNASVESKLAAEWNDLKSGRTWDQVKANVRYGWDRARRATRDKN